MVSALAIVMVIWRRAKGQKGHRKFRCGCYRGVTSSAEGGSVLDARRKREMPFETDSEKLRKIAQQTFEAYDKITQSAEAMRRQVEDAYRTVDRGLLNPAMFAAAHGIGDAINASRREFEDWQQRMLQSPTPRVSEDLARYEAATLGVLYPNINPIIPQIASLLHSEAASTIRLPQITSHEARQDAELQTQAQEIAELRAEVKRLREELHPEPPPKDDRPDTGTGLYL
jgi:hypothetical protein